MDKIVIYLKEDKLPEDREQAWRVSYYAEHYLLLNQKLYKRGVSMPLLRCLNDEEAKEVLIEIYNGVYGNHVGAIPYTQGFVVGILLAHDETRY